MDHGVQRWRGIASTLFAVALLASGQNATITGTISGQIVMEGFINLRISPWLRRLITRLLAVIPAFIVIWLGGSKGTGEMTVMESSHFKFSPPICCDSFSIIYK